MSHEQLDEVIASTCRRIVEERCDNILIGPIVFDDHDRSYFTLITGRWLGSGNTGGFYAHSRKEAETVRASMMLAIAQDCGPVVMHDFDDEFRMVKLAEILWPQRFASVRQAMEKERSADQS